MTNRISYSSYREDEREFNYKKKYFFTVFIFTPHIKIYEMTPIANCESPGYEVFVTEKDFKRIWRFHKSIKNHSPYLNQTWVSECVDVWESITDCKVYDTKKECEEAAMKILKKVYKNTYC